MKSVQAVILVLVTMVTTYFMVRPEPRETTPQIRRVPAGASVAEAFDTYDRRLGRVEDLMVGMGQTLGKIREAQKKATIPKPRINPNRKLESLLEEIQENFEGVTAEQLALIEQVMRLPAEQAAYEREIIIKNQIAVSDLVKDVQWESTPTHQIIIGTLRDLSQRIPYGTDNIIDPVLKSFPTEIHLATPSLRATAKQRNAETDKVMKLLLDSGGVFTLHVLLEDFAENADEHYVQSFLKENLARSHIVIYGGSVAELLTAFKKHQTRQLFTQFRPHIRLHIGPRTFELRGARNNIACKDFLTSILQTPRYTRR